MIYSMQIFLNDCTSSCNENHQLIYFKYNCLFSMTNPVFFQTLLQCPSFLKIFCSVQSEIIFEKEKLLITWLEGSLSFTSILSIFPNFIQSVHAYFYVSLIYQNYFFNAMF